MMRIWLRNWRRSPLLASQFFVTIAVGMGATAALVSLMLALGYQPLPFRDSGQLVAVWERSDSGPPFQPISGPDMVDFANATHGTFSSLGAFWVARLWLLDRQGAASVQSCSIQASVFSNLGIRPVLGREVRPDDEPLTSGEMPAAWISYRIWRTRYGGSASVVGATIGIADDAAGSDALKARIAGVFPEGVSIPGPFNNEGATDLWYAAPPNIAARPRQIPLFFGVGRLRPGVGASQAQAALSTVAEQLGRQYSFDRRNKPVVQTLEAIAQGPARQTMGLLGLGVGLVFLVGCVNLAVLMGVEGRRRRREIAIRAVLGADRSRLWQEVAAEKCLLTLFSLAAGIAIAFASLRVLAQLMPAAGLGPALLNPPPLSLYVLVGFAALALIAALVWSALVVATADERRSSLAVAASSGFGYSGVSDSGHGAGRWRLILLALQAGTGICLLAAAALASRTYVSASAANLGPEPRHTVLLSVSPRDYFLPADAQVLDFNQQVLARLERLPGEKSVAMADRFPPSGIPVPFIKQGEANGTQRETSDPISISPGYFRTLGIPILFGRSFDDADNEGSEPVAIVSHDMAEENWPSPAQAVGSQISLGSKFQTHYKIVGVAANFTGYWSQKPSPTLYLPSAQAAYHFGGSVILRTSASPSAVAALAPQALAGMAIPATVSNVSTMQSRWQATLTRPLARMAGMLMLALLGLALSAQGIYAVAAGTVSARRHELAVRSALGASPSRLVWNLTRDLVLAVLVGAGLGVLVSLDLRPLLKQWLGPAAVWQAEPIAVAVVLLALAAAVGCYIPARAAARANPADILREG